MQERGWTPLVMPAPWAGHGRAARAFQWVYASRRVRGTALKPRRTGPGRFRWSCERRCPSSRSGLPGAMPAVRAKSPRTSAGCADGPGPQLHARGTGVLRSKQSARGSGQEALRSGQIAPDAELICLRTQAAQPGGNTFLPGTPSFLLRKRSKFLQRRSNLPWRRVARSSTRGAQIPLGAADWSAARAFWPDARAPNSECGSRTPHSGAICFAR